MIVDYHYYMSPDLVQITTVLTQCSADQPRRLVVLAGKFDEKTSLLESLLTELGEAALCFSDVPAFGHLPNVHAVKKAITVLGQEKSLVVMDCEHDIEPDALAAIAGVVTGGGWLVLSLPARAHWTDYADSLFRQRFIRSIEAAEAMATAVVIDCHTDPLKQLRAVASQQLRHDQLKVGAENTLRLTTDQQSVLGAIDAVANSTQQACVIVSDRGRGKSSVLGVAAARLMQSGSYNILLTAPRLKACEKVFEHACRELGIEGVRSSLSYQQSDLQFIAPDELCQGTNDADDKQPVLLVDEAASIPVPILKQLLHKFPRCVFATTVHGYEGTGRGFAIRFYKELDQSRPTWQKIEMKTPVRWPQDDALEQWLFQFLCLDADLPVLSADILPQQIDYRQITPAELAENEVLLRDVFACLVLAHYRTRPSDLKRLLDDDVIITIAQYQFDIIGVVLSVDEGGFNAELAQQIYQGHRRPAGHLLAQNLTYHCGSQAAGSLIVHRIMRIVVHPDLQAKGIGSHLVQQVIAQARQRSVDLIGASFGMTKPLLTFWQHNGFELVRVGFTREQSSSEHACLLIRGLSTAGQSVADDVKQRFLCHWPYLAATLLRDVRSELPELKGTGRRPALTAADLQDVRGFVEFSRAYELSIAGVNQWLLENQPYWQQGDFPPDYRQIIEAVILQQQDWKTTGEQMQLTGKNQARQLFKQAVSALWNQLNPA